MESSRSERSGAQAPNSDWSSYYSKQAGRSVRATFLAGLGARATDGAGHAIDVGCGDGVETRELLRRGWTVLALDGDPGVVDRVSAGVSGPELARLDVRRSDFADIVDLPPVDLVYAGFALPFCVPAAFPALWATIRSALVSGSVFAGEFFGPDDEWSARNDMNFHDRASVEGLLNGLDVVQLIEDNRDGRSVHGPKRWHVFHVVARGR